MMTSRSAWLPLLAAFFLAAIAGAPAPGQSRSSNEVTQPFIGAWHLASLDQPDPDGKPHSIPCCGLLVFTADGHISLQVMDRHPPPQPASGRQQYSQAGYEAFWGTCVVDPRAHTFTFHVEGALVPSLIGQNLPRLYRLSGNKLVIQSTHPDEHWRAVWERY